MDNGRIRLTLAKKRRCLTSIRARHGGREVELGNGKTALYFDARYWLFGLNRSSSVGIPAPGNCATSCSLAVVRMLMFPCKSPLA